MTDQGSVQPATDPFELYHSTRRFSCLDGIRFICITAVIWHHSPLSAQYFADMQFAGRGFLGVDFFFVLSGYLITTLLLREEKLNGRFSLSAFYWRRFLRIVPVYFFVVTAVGLYYVVFKQEHQMAGIWPHYYLFLADFLKDHIPLLSPTWSLAVEEQYYMIWPLLLLLMPRPVVFPVLVLLITVNVLAFMRVIDVTPLETEYLIFKLPIATFAPILIGSALAMLLNVPARFRVIYLVLGRPLAPVICWVYLILYVIYTPHDIAGLPNLFIHLLMACCLCTLVIRDKNILTPLLSLPWIARIGQISYGLYLYHLIAMYVANKILTRLEIDSGWAVLVLYYLLSIAMAEISFRTLERYFLNLRRTSS